jgi:hypothetical protein
MSNSPTAAAFWVPTGGPEGWRALLADPPKHWVRGRSARTLAHCWEAADGWPPEVRRALSSSADLNGLEPLYGFPEFKVPLPGGSRSSQTDLMVIARGADGLVVVAVEGKVDEPFGPYVEEWLGDAPSKGKVTRLQYLCDLLGLDPVEVVGIRYQLLHRTASALIEASRIGAATALMLVHTWGTKPASFDDFSAFANLLGSKVAAGATAVTSVDSPRLYLGWAAGDPRWLSS